MQRADGKRLSRSDQLLGGVHPLEGVWLDAIDHNGRLEGDIGAWYEVLAAHRPRNLNLKI